MTKILFDIAIALVYIAGIAKGFMDSLQFHFNTSLFAKLNQQFWNPEISWQNKYSEVVTLTRRKLFTIRLGSFSVDVPYPAFLTDGWHLFQFIYLECLFVSIFFFALALKQFNCLNIFNMALLVLMMRLAFGIGFLISYRAKNIGIGGKNA